MREAHHSPRTSRESPERRTFRREAVDEDDHERVLVALKHRELPKLDDADVVEFDDVAETVSTDESIDDFDPLL